ncbi:MAG: PAS domain S-box protein [Spirochaetota bacterium]
MTLFLSLVVVPGFEKDLSKVLVSFIDVTERKEAEIALKESEGHLRAIIETTQDGYWLVDAHARIIDVNEAYCRMTGYDRATLLSFHVSDLEAAEAPAETIARMERVKASGSELFETRHRRRDGSSFDVEISTTWLAHGGGEYVCFCRDISGRKRADEKIGQLLKEKELILREVHHRIKNNMNSIFSLLSYQAETSDDARIRAVLVDAAGRVRSMGVLYEKLYRSQGTEDLSLREYLPSLLSEMVSFLPSAASIEIRSEIEDFLLDERKLSPIGIILYELVSNALKYAFPGRDNGRITLVVSRKEDRVSLVFEDDGVGLPERISVEYSTGFGVTLVGVLVSQLGGTVEIERVGGTRFVIAFEA